MTVAFGSIGAAAVGTTSLSVAYPSSISAGDMLVLSVASKAPNGNEIATTPAGWTASSTNTFGVGSEGVADQGTVVCCLFWKIASGSESGSLSVTIQGTGPNSAIGTIARYTKSSTTYWATPTTAAGIDDGTDGVALDPSPTTLTLVTGDMVVWGMAANTDAFSYSSHACTVAGATIAAGSERNDSGTTNGTDCALVVVDFAVTAGSGTAIPSYTATASGSTNLALSGVWLVLHERTGISFVAAGAAAVGSTSLAVPYPTGIISGDKLVLCIANKYPANGPSTPAGWTLVSNAQGSGGAGAAGADSGTIYSTVFHKTSDGTETGNLTVTLTSANSSIGRMLAYRAPPSNVWAVAAHNGADNTAGTGFSVTCGADPGELAGDMVVVCAAVNTDARTFASEAISATGISVWGTVVERNDSVTTTGDDCALVISEHPVTTGTSSSAPVFTMTASGTAGNQGGGSAVVFRMRSTVAYTLTCAVGAYTWTGVAAGLKVGRKLACDGGPYTWTGVAATLTYTPAPSGPALLDSDFGNGGGSATATLTIGGVSAFIVVWVLVQSNVAPILTVTDSDGGTYTPLASGGTGSFGAIRTSGPCARLFPYYRSAPATSATTLAITAQDFDDPILVNITAQAWSGITLHGSAAIRSVGSETLASSGGTPAPIMSHAALTTSIVVGAVGLLTPSAMTPPTGWTEDFDSGGSSYIENVYRISGSTSATLTWGSTAGADYAAWAIEIDTSTGYTLAIGTGSYAWTGNAVGFKVTMPAAVGAYTWTGNPAGLIAQRKLTCAAGSYAWTGNAAGLGVGRKLAAGTGAYVWTGVAAGLRAQRRLLCAVGAYAWAGGAAGLGFRSLACAGGAYTWTGNAAGLTATRRLACATGAFVWTGNATGLAPSSLPGGRWNHMWLGIGLDL